MELEELINKFDTEGFYFGFPKIEMTEGHEGEIQPSDIDGVEFEIINQVGCADHGFSGTVAIPYGSGLYCLVIPFSE